MGTATAAPLSFLLWTRYRDSSGTATAALQSCMLCARYRDHK